MPFGFDTRVLALAHEPFPNGSVVIARFAQRAAMIALAVFALEIDSCFCVGVSCRRCLWIFRHRPHALFFRANGFGVHGATHEAAFARGIEAHATADAANFTYYRSRRFSAENETRTNHA